MLPASAPGATQGSCENEIPHSMSEGGLFSIDLSDRSVGIREAALRSARCHGSPAPGDMFKNEDEEPGRGDGYKNPNGAHDQRRNKLPLHKSPFDNGRDKRFSLEAGLVCGSVRPPGLCLEAPRHELGFLPSAVDGEPAHALPSLVEVISLRSTPFFLASALMSRIRQRGMLPLVFQLDTVEGVRSSAAATFTVPPSASTIWAAWIMSTIITITVI